jgi:hypothetical protein
MSGKNGGSTNILSSLGFSIISPDPTGEFKGFGSTNSNDDFQWRVLHNVAEIMAER